MTKNTGAGRFALLSASRTLLGSYSLGVLDGTRDSWGKCSPHMVPAACAPEIVKGRAVTDEAVEARVLHGESVPMSFDAEEAALHLASEMHEERVEGLRQVYEHYCPRILAFLKGRYGLPLDACRDILQAAMTALCQKVERREFDLDGSLNALVYRIARNKAGDHFRYMRRNQLQDCDSADDGERMTELGSLLRDTEAGSVYGSLDEVEKKEVLGLIRETILELPDRQKLVFRVRLEHPDAPLEEVRGIASRLADEPLSYVAVKRAVQEARKKVAAALSSRGYP